LGSADPLYCAKLLEVFGRQGVRRIIYYGEGDFTSEIVPAKYLREDAIRETPISVGERSREPSLILPKGALFPKNGTIRFFSGPIRARIGFSPSKKKIRANRRNWLADPVPDRQ
jgi:hypothetical protein